MIKPHGSETLDARYVADEQARAALAAEAEQLPSLLLNSAAAANAVMLGGGYFNPLAGYMNRCLLYTSPSPRDGLLSRMPSSA